MGRKVNTAKALVERWEVEESRTPEREEKRSLTLRKEPLSRKLQLMEAGVREIRCISCMRIGAIAGAEELDEGWVCGDCLSGAAEQRRRAG